jgi:hypothetical protein
LQGKLIPILGTWHPFKQGHSLLWCLAAKSFLKGLFQCICPGDGFYLKAKLRQQQTYFTYIRLAYPEFKDALTEAIATRAGNATSQALLLNLQTMCEVLIPLVSLCSVRYVYMMPRSVK